MLFEKIRRTQKPVFLFLGAVFMLSFVFLGVGSGVGGISLGDLLGTSSSSSSSISGLNDQVRKDPKNAAAWLRLADAYEADGQTDPALGAYTAVPVAAAQGRRHHLAGGGPLRDAGGAGGRRGQLLAGAGQPVPAHQRPAVEQRRQADGGVSVGSGDVGPAAAAAEVADAAAAGAGRRLAGRDAVEEGDRAEPERFDARAQPLPRRALPAGLRDRLRRPSSGCWRSSPTRPTRSSSRACSSS